MGELDRRVEKLEEITGDKQKGVALIRVNSECEHATTCHKIGKRIEAAEAKGPVVRLTTNVDDEFPDCTGCSTFKKKGAVRNEH
jgi:hypothetical protein